VICVSLRVDGRWCVVVQVLPEYKHLLNVQVDEESGNCRTYSVDVDSSWWSMDDPPPLSLLVWSKSPNQKMKIPVRCTGHRMTDDTAAGPLQWIIGLLVLISTTIGESFTDTYTIKLFSWGKNDLT
jgi:hypothetical protein